jgi:hypothetical protein
MAVEEPALSALGAQKLSSPRATSASDLSFSSIGDERSYPPLTPRIRREQRKLELEECGHKRGRERMRAWLPPPES